MKKVLFVAAFLTAGIISQAQITYGVKAGVNFANWVGDDVDNADMKISFHAGGLVNIPVNAMFSVQPEVVYSDQGFKTDEGKLNASYINVPVMFQYNNPSGFYAETGPQIGFLMSAKTKVDGAPDTDVKDLLKSTDFAWGLGFGFKMPSGLGFGARYNFGLSKLGEEGDGNIKNSVIQAGLFYTFGKK